MNQTRKNELLEKYHAGRLTEAENLELEQCIEAGLIELDELEDIRQLNYQLSGLAEELSSLRMRTRFKEELTDLIDPRDTRMALTVGLSMSYNRDWVSQGAPRYGVFRM